MIKKEIEKEICLLEKEDVISAVSKMLGREVKLKDIDVKLIICVPYASCEKCDLSGCRIDCEFYVNNRMVCDDNHNGPLKDFFDDLDFYLADDEIFAFDMSEFKTFKRDVDLVDEMGGRLMDYRNAVGETVVRYDGVKGIITQVDEGNVVHIQFDGEKFAGGYLYDPFINEDVIFVNSERQKQIDAKVNELHEKAKATMHKYMVDSSKGETFRITKDNEDGSTEVVCRLKCSKEDAYSVFTLIIKDQQKEYRKAGGRIKWRVIRLFDSENNQQIAQES